MRGARPRSPRLDPPRIVAGLAWGLRSQLDKIERRRIRPGIIAQGPCSNLRAFMIERAHLSTGEPAPGRALYSDLETEGLAYRYRRGGAPDVHVRPMRHGHEGERGRRLFMPDAVLLDRREHR